MHHNKRGVKEILGPDCLLAQNTISSLSHPSNFLQTNESSTRLLVLNSEFQSHSWVSHFVGYWVKKEQLYFLLCFKKNVPSGCRDFLAGLVSETFSPVPCVKHLGLESCDTDGALLADLSTLEASFLDPHLQHSTFPELQQQPRSHLSSTG